MLITTGQTKKLKKNGFQLLEKVSIKLEREATKLKCPLKVRSAAIIQHVTILGTPQNDSHRTSEEAKHENSGHILMK